ncbi:thiamine biosynthesis protein ThiI [Marinitoga hydrogenitolerans DSM 16785]|uniref:Probable tRNA sulfurtransferase n=1 Tax=Marinitoga hydrogenitolerans (strain DSM 16785 / JCM 12826 / AT1271) TaxID=1122195 RepID=A0A1M4WJF0_MARH1|nr:tRNA uracil 4-sulfurtransferase ThiI [Marinitoga hydrogenitolerans]SHE81280.1 thiamine biosynthesis protein ThiI [Marinitoga hydrogenitolerans DSM 16785]
MYDFVVIKYSEIGTKGKNRRIFESKLMNNIVLQLNHKVSAKKIYGRIIVTPKENEKIDESLLNSLKKVFGIKSISPAIQVKKDYEDIKNKIIWLLKEKKIERGTFKIVARRTDKTFPIRSFDLNKNLGADILNEFSELKVDVHKPNYLIRVEIRQELSFIYFENIECFAGYPVGAGGKASIMLSGGIDSPVAAWTMMKRGLKLNAISFYSPPSNNEKTITKLLELSKRLSEFYPFNFYHYIIPFTNVQLAIKNLKAESYSLILQRRSMLRIASVLAKHTKSTALITGENLGQVASQTLENMISISKATDMLILRPLIGYEKLEIVKKAQEIGTYDISIWPYKDSCVAFLPKSPATKSFPNKMKKLETKIENFSELELDALNNSLVYVIKNGKIIENYIFSEKEVIDYE